MVPEATLRATLLAPAGGGGGGLEACERACCEDRLCHSVTWRANTSTCVAALVIDHGARPDDRCWHPTASAHAITSIRLPGEWEEAARHEARSYLASRHLVRRGPGLGPRVFAKPFSDPVGHSHPMERAVEPLSCDAPAATPAGGYEISGYEISDATAAAVPYARQLSGCPGHSPTSWVPKPTQPGQRGRWGRRRVG